MSEHIVILTDENFDKEVGQSDVPVLVDFGAEWCSPCKTLEPIMADIAKTYKGKLKVAKLDVDHNPRATMEHGIMSIPTVVIYYNGKLLDEIVGLQNKNRILKRVMAYI